MAALKRTKTLVLGIILVLSRATFTTGQTNASVIQETTYNNTIAPSIDENSGAEESDLLTSLSNVKDSAASSPELDMDSSLHTLLENEREINRPSWPRSKDIQSSVNGNETTTVASSTEPAVTSTPSPSSEQQNSETQHSTEPFSLISLLRAFISPDGSGLSGFIQILREQMSRGSISQSLPRPNGTNEACYNDVIDFLDGLIGARGPGNQSLRSLPFALRIHPVSPNAQNSWVEDDGCTILSIDNPEIVMLDSMGRPLPGILSGGFQFVGQYDQCLDTTAVVHAGVTLGGVKRNETTIFGTRYCRASIPFEFVWDPELVGRLNSFWKENEHVYPLIKWGLCVPNTCYSEDIQALLVESVFEEIGYGVEKTICFESEHLGSDFAAVITIIILVLFVVVVLGGTGLQYYFQNTKTGSYDFGASNADTRRDLKTDTTADRVMNAFSISVNVEKLLDTSSEKGIITCLEGLRVIGILWIVLGHTYMYGGMVNPEDNVIGNVLVSSDLTESVPFHFVVAGNLAVDTFFVMSGFLGSLIAIRKLTPLMKKSIPTSKKMTGILNNSVLYVFSRYIRLTPVYMMVLMASTNLYDHVVSGPLRDVNKDEILQCRKDWWKHLLYINNFETSNTECMTWTWFLALNFQLAILTPFLVVPTVINKKLGVSIMILFMLLGMGTTFASELHYGGQFLLMDLSFRDYWHYVYTMPWGRFSSYTVGLLLGVLMADMDRSKLPMSKIKALIVWLSMLGLGLTLTFITHLQWRPGAELWSNKVQAFYETLSRLLWALCIAWIIFACCTGLGDAVNAFLSWKPFIPLGKLTYNVYLLHPVIILYVAYSRRMPFFFHPHHITIIYNFLGNLVLAFLMAALAHIFIEMPVANLVDAFIIQKLVPKKLHQNGNS